VVIPSFNHARFIAETIRSVFAQTHVDLELHVLDDGSTDGSPEVIERALSAAPAGMRCEFSVRRNQGCSAALNQLISGVRAEWVAILNSDDLLAPSRFERMLMDVPEAGHHLGFSAVDFLFGEEASDEEAWREFYPGMFRGGLSLPSTGFALLRGNFAITSSNFLFDRALFERGVRFRDDLPLSQDWDFLLQTLRHVEPVFHPEPLLRYRVHASNTYRNHRDRQRTELRLLFGGFSDWACRPAENPLAPTPGNWPRLFPVFARVCRLGSGEPLGALLPPAMLQKAPLSPDAADLPSGFETASIRRLVSGGVLPSSLAEGSTTDLARACHRHWSAIRDLVGGPHLPGIPRDGVLSWAGADVRVTTDDPGLLGRVQQFTGLTMTWDVPLPGHRDLVMLGDRRVRVHAADRSEEKTFETQEDLWAWLVLSVSDLLAVRARLTLVHGASFLLRGGVVLLCGEPWSGKSTFSLRALESGLPVLGDDLTWIDPADGTASPCPRPVKRRVLETEERQSLAEWPDGTFLACLDGERSLLFPRRSSGFVGVNERHPVRWVIHLCRQPEPGLTVETLEPGAWGPALRGQLRNFSPRPDQAADLVVDALSGAAHTRLRVGEGEVDAAFRWLMDLH
jgi:glycosyltransferase involved in cell wall biosynthesis